MQCIYLYDFGDHWLHVVDRLGEKEIPEVFTRRLVGGTRALPPEVCGGVGGYQRMMQVVE